MWIHNKPALNSPQHSICWKTTGGNSMKYVPYSIFGKLKWQNNRKRPSNLADVESPWKKRRLQISQEKSELDISLNQPAKEALNSPQHSICWKTTRGNSMKYVPYSIFGKLKWQNNRKRPSNLADVESPWKKRRLQISQEKSELDISFDQPAKEACTVQAFSTSEFPVQKTFRRLKFTPKRGKMGSPVMTESEGQIAERTTQHEGCKEADHPKPQPEFPVQKPFRRLKITPKRGKRGSHVMTESQAQMAEPTTQHEGCKEADHLKSQQRGQIRPSNLVDGEPHQKRLRLQMSRDEADLDISFNQPAKQALNSPQHSICWKTTGGNSMKYVPYSIFGKLKWQNNRKRPSNLADVESPWKKRRLQISQEKSELDISLNQPAKEGWNSTRHIGHWRGDGREFADLEMLLQNIYHHLKITQKLGKKDSLFQVQFAEPTTLGFQGYKKTDQPKPERRGQTRHLDLTDEGTQQKRPRQEISQEKTGLDNSSTQPAYLKVYKKGNLLGRGGFGCVFSGTRKADGLPVAMKYVSKMKDDVKLEISGHGWMPIEVAMMTLLKREPSCSNILKMLEWYDEPDRYIMILERPDPCQDLKQFCKNHGGSLTESMARNVMVQIIKALKHCKSCGILHRDVKPENVLVQTDTLEVKLSDFGCGDLIKDSYDYFAGTRPYYPPEWFIRRQYMAEPLTVWSVGVMLYDLLCGSLPFKNVKQIKKGQLRFPKTLPQKCRDLIQWCLHADAAKRPSLEQIELHQWFHLPG